MAVLSMKHPWGRQCPLAQDACSSACECRVLHFFGALANLREYRCWGQDVSGRLWMHASSSEAQPSTAASGTRGDWGRGYTEGSISNESHSLMHWTLPSSPLPSPPTLLLITQVILFGLRGQFQQTIIEEWRESDKIRKGHHSSRDQ